MRFFASQRHCCLLVYDVSVFNNSNNCSTIENIDLHQGGAMCIPCIQWHLYGRTEEAMPSEVWHASKLTPIFHTLKFSRAAARVTGIVRY